MSETFPLLAALLACIDLFTLLLLHQLRCSELSRSCFTSTLIIGRRYKESFLSVHGLPDLLQVHFGIGRLQGRVYIPASGGYILPYLLYCTEYSPA